MNLCRADPLDGGEIKRVERLHLRETCLAQALPNDRFMTRGQLGAEDFVQIVFVRPVRVTRLPRQTVKRARDARELERAGVRDDEIAGDDGRAHTASASQPS